MKESIHKYFQVGVIHGMSYPSSRYNTLESLKKVLCDEFFDAIEISTIPDDGDREKAKMILEQSHIKVCYAAQSRLLGPKLNPNDIDEEKRKAAEKTLIEAIDEAEYLGADGIAFLSGKWSEEKRELAYNQLLKTTRKVCDYAASKNMMVELEVFDYDVDKASLIGPAPYAARFAADMRMTHQNFGLVVDLSHLPITRETSKFAIQTMRPYITHFHIGNAVVEKGQPAYGDLHPRFGFPYGANDVSELVDFFNVLKAEGFFDPKHPYILSFEVQPYGDEDGDIVLANTKRTINRAWALVED